MRLMQSDISRRPGGGAVHDIAPVSVVTLVAMLAAPASAGSGQAARERQAGKDETGAPPGEVLASIVGDAESESLIARARQDLWQRIGLLLDEEMLRFGSIVDEAGEVDPVAAVRLYQAEYSLEAAR